VKHPLEIVMPARIDERLLVVNLDSGALAGTATIVHPLAKAGNWTLTVRRADGPALTSFSIQVRDDAEKFVAAVDLSTAEREGRGSGAVNPSATLRVRTGGHLALFCSQPRAGYAAALDPSDPQRAACGKHSWDSQQLQKGDQFVCMPLRPGRYTLANTLSDTKCTLTVRYPDPRTPLRDDPTRSQPLRVQVKESFSVEKLELVPTRGLVLEVGDDARFSLELVEPDDGPRDLESWKTEHDERLLAALLSGS
jgi:hypothetical protein